LQTTGKINYLAFSKFIKDPKIMKTPDTCNWLFFEAALFFFKENNLWVICDKGVNADTILALSKRINGGTNGLEDRVSLTNRYYKWLT
jgi:putative chitinase